MANIYAVRVHELADTISARVVDFCQAAGGSYLVVRETDATRTHYQGWIRCDVKPQALRARLKKAFPECVGNRSYSLTAVKDYESYHRYLLKGTESEMPHVVAYQGIELNDETIAAQHRAYWSMHGKPSKSNRAILDEVEEWVAAQKWTDIEQQKYEVAEHICDVITSRKKGLNTFYARAVYNTVMYRASEESRRRLVNEIIFER